MPKPSSPRALPLGSARIALESSSSEMVFVSSSFISGVTLVGTTLSPHSALATCTSRVIGSALGPHCSTVPGRSWRRTWTIPLEYLTLSHCPSSLESGLVWIALLQCVHHNCFVCLGSYCVWVAVACMHAHAMNGQHWGST